MRSARRIDESSLTDRLPDPTEQNFHPYGLASYALTYTGYQLVENLITWERPA